MTENKVKPLPAKPNEGAPQSPAKAPAPVEVPTATKKPTAANTVRAVASPARMKRRHWAGVGSFLGLVVAPLIIFSLYLWVLAADQYASTTGFTVRSEEGGGASEVFGGLMQLAGSSGGAMDADILFEYIQSQEIVSEVESKLDIRNHYSSNWPSDFLFSIWPDATSEELNWFWQRFVNLSYDKSSGLIEVQVLAFDPQTAQDIATEIVKLSQSLINDLSIQAREDATRYAREELEDNLERLKAAREALTGFRTRTQILDPAADIQARMGVLQNLQQQLAQTLIEHDMLSETVNASDPRIEKFQRRIEVIRQRIASEGQTYASARTTTGAVGEDYPLLLAEYESLMIDQQFSEETYRVALAALDVAKAKAARQSRYLAVYIQPTKAEKSEYPRRFVLLGLTALLLLLLWSTLVLIYYSVRDRG